MISFDTTPHSSNVDLVWYIAALSEGMGLHVEIQNEILHGVEQQNIIIRQTEYGSGESHLLLQSHLDTADPGPFALWKKNNQNPFSATIEEGFIYGVGSADVKIDFLCKLVALRDTKMNKFSSLRPVLVGTFGQESGMNGALKLIRKNRVNARYAVVSEPSNLQLINASKGFVTVEMRIPHSAAEIAWRRRRNSNEAVSTESKIFSGKTAHSSTPDLGENAAVKLLDYLSALPADTILLDIDAGSRFNMIPHQAVVEIDRMESTPAQPDSSFAKINRVFRLIQDVEDDMKKFADNQFSPAHSTMSIGVLRMFEEYILIGGSCRIVPTVTQDIFDRWVEKISTSCGEIGVSFHIQDYKKPFRTDTDSILVRTIQSELGRLNMDAECRSIPSTNEASLFSRVGVETVCMGVGAREENIHTANECVSLEQAQVAVQLYRKIIERLCS